MRSTLGFVMNLGILISKVAMAAVMNKKPSDTSGMLEIIFIGPGQSAPTPPRSNVLLWSTFSSMATKSAVVYQPKTKVVMSLKAFECH